MPVLNDLKNKKLFISGLIILVIVSIMAYYNYLLVQPVSKILNINNQELIHIKSGSTLDNITNKLTEKNLIAEPLLFKFYVRLSGVAPKLKAGYYRLSSKMSMIEIVNKLVTGEMATYKLTIPEGITIESIANRLVKQGVDREIFLTLARNKELGFLDISSKEREEIFYSLEGFLFPDTYRIPYGSSAQEIIEIMLQGFKERINSLKDKIQASQYSLREIITIASLIQAEGQLNNELPVIASVIYNRLDIRMKLQIDATIQYILPERKSRLLYSDLEVESAYNTYLHYGLPPGPINNPGLTAVKAALNPAETDYLYYVAIGDGEHKFTKSYREHLEVQNRLESRE